jgi:hypothetical protein
MNSVAIPITTVIFIAGIAGYIYYPTYKEQSAIANKCYNATIADSEVYGDLSLLKSSIPYQRCIRQKGDPTVYDLTDYGYLQNKKGEYYFVGVEKAMASKMNK